MNLDPAFLKQLALQAMTWSVVVAGWWIVNLQNNRREARKEARSLTDGSKQSAKKICELGKGYLTSQIESQRLAVEIKAELDLLELELARFNDFSERSNLMTKFSEFAESITGGDFESADRVVCAIDSDSVKLVNRCLRELLGEMEMQFKHRFID